MNKKQIEIDDRLVDEIVGEIIDSMKKGQPAAKFDGAQMQYINEIARLKARIVNLENRVEKYVGNFKINATESARKISETESSLQENYEHQIIALQGQLENLRTAMIRLSGEVKRIKDILSPAR